jgi:DNA-binding transcriptional LysR family regulator
MDIGAVQLFIEVARRGNFASVARDRGMEPSSVSRIIGVLEAELGFRLFQRTTRRSSLTEAGEVYLQRVAQVVEQIEGAREDGMAVSAGPAGHLRMTASVAFGTTQLVPLLPAFRSEFPRISIELLLADANLDLVAERIDFAIRLAPAIQGDLVTTKLTDTRYRVCATPEYLARHGAPDVPGDLESRRCLLFTFPEYRTRWRFRPHPEGPEEVVRVAGDIVISNALALRDATLLGLGPALLPDWLMAGALASGALVDLFPRFRVTATDFATAAWLLYPSREHLPAKVRVAIDFLKRHVSRESSERSILT